MFANWEIASRIKEAFQNTELLEDLTTEIVEKVRNNDE